MRRGTKLRNYEWVAMVGAALQKKRLRRSQELKNLPRPGRNRLRSPGRKQNLYRNGPPLRKAAPSPLQDLKLRNANNIFGKEKNHALDNHYYFIGALGFRVRICRCGGRKPHSPSSRRSYRHLCCAARDGPARRIGLIGERYA